MISGPGRGAVWCWSISGFLHVAAIGALACTSNQLVAPLWQALPTRDGHHSIELVGAMEASPASHSPISFEPPTEQVGSDQSPQKPADPQLEPRRLAETGRVVPTQVDSPVMPMRSELPDERVVALSRVLPEQAPTRRDASQGGESAPQVGEPPREPVSAPFAPRQGTTARLPSTVVELETPELQQSMQASQAQPTSRRADGTESEPVPKVRFNPPPEYPASALRAGIEGRVVVRVELTRDGRVASATVHASSGHEALDEAALAAVRRWRFEPISEGPARSTGARTVAVPVRFAIEK